MTHEKYKQLPRWQVVVLALLDLSGATELVATEDITVKAWQEAPNLFCLKGFPQHPDMYIAERALRVARSDEHGSLVSGDKRRGWRLSPAGLSWIKAERADGGGEVRPLDRLSSNAARSLRKFKSVPIFRRWLSGERDGHKYLLAETLELPVDSPKAVIRGRLDEAMNAAAIVGDQQLGDFLQWLGELGEKV